MFRFSLLPFRAHVRARSSAVFAVLVSAACILSHAQTAAAQAGASPRRYTVTAGLGNPMGWLGAQGEAYFAREHLSVFLGLGYTPEFDSFEPSGATFAAGMRAYTSGLRHRGYVELSVSQLMTVAEDEEYVDGGWVTASGQRLYGPGLQVGYQYAALSGFTLHASLGVGYAPTADGTDLGFYPFDQWAPMAALGFGYTWR